MKMRLFRRLVLLIFLVSSPCLMGAQWVSPPEGFSISYMVNRSALVFTGEVVNLQFVFRENIPPQWTTDVTVKVEEVIKGETNAAENLNAENNLVKFMIPGGERVNPTTG